jgi:hypothetical protein
MLSSERKIYLLPGVRALMEGRKPAVLQPRTATIYLRRPCNSTEEMAKDS